MEDRRGRPRWASQAGQATVEWLGLVLLVALLIGSLLWATELLRVGLALPASILERFVCAARLSEDCRDEPELRASYGAELAAAVRAHAPALLYEEGMTALPVDYRRCRADGCAAGEPEGAVSRSDSGERVVAFTHVVDCRREGVAASKARGADCSGPRAGNLYLQYWFYYPGSATAEGSTPLKGVIRTASAKLGHPTHHPDDWESYQVRLGPRGSSARASSHDGYSYAVGYDGRGVIDGWGPERDTLYVSGGSHAGSARTTEAVTRSSKDGRLVLVPLGRVAVRKAPPFAVTPPWRKRVYFDPEYTATD